MINVAVNSKTYRVIKGASDDIETMFIVGRTEPVEYVAGVCEDEKHNRYEVDWYLDCDTDNLPEDASEWVSDWNTADKAHLMED